MIPFRTRQMLRRILVTVLVLALLAAVVLGCWVLWLNRYVIYTRDGAKLDFNLSPTLSEGNAAVPPVPGKPVDIVYQEDLGVEMPEDNVLKPLKGYFADTTALKMDLSRVTESLTKLPADTPILFDVKNVRSEFYYVSGLGKEASDMDTEALTALITELKRTDHYLVARLPAFREYYYILDDEDTRVAFGLPRAGGNGALWLDESGPNYWMNPISDGTLSHLVQIVAELKALGFDEVVFDDFCFPDTDRIAYDGDREAAIRDAAAFLVKVCTDEDFAVSFISEDPMFPLPEGRCRLYLKNAAAEDVVSLVERTGLDPESGRLVFLTDTLDTRFDDYGVLRPAGSIS